MGQHTIEVTSQNFQDEVLSAEGPVLVDFWATWCKPCTMVAPIVDELADQYVGKVKVGKLDVDAHQDIMIKYGVMSIPTLIVFKNGKPIERLVGFQGREKMLQKLEAHFN
jgi:thioredoxin 1